MFITFCYDIIVIAYNVVYVMFVYIITLLSYYNLSYDINVILYRLRSKHGKNYIF